MVPTIHLLIEATSMRDFTLLIPQFIRRQRLTDLCDRLLHGVQDFALRGYLTCNKLVFLLGFHLV